MWFHGGTLQVSSRQVLMQRPPEHMLPRPSFYMFTESKEGEEETWREFMSVPLLLLSPSFLAEESQHNRAF